MKKIIKKISIIFTLLILVVCIILGKAKFKSNVNTSTTNNNTAKEENYNVQHKNISIDDVINTLCSDKFEGRLSGTKGNDYTVQYISDIFEDLKLNYVFQNSYFHEYPLKIQNMARTGHVETIVKNVIGKISGSNNKNAVIISAHFDHIGIDEGLLYRGALDNASGTSALLKIAQDLKEESEKRPFDFDIIICAFNGEEYNLSGSKAFVKDIQTKYDKLCNINIDCIGSLDGGNLALKNISRIQDSEKLYQGVKYAMEKHKIEFSNTVIGEEAVRQGLGLGDHHSFEKAGIPNIFIGQEGIEPLVHKITDVPEKLDYSKIGKISDAICDFVESNISGMFLYFTAPVKGT